MRVLNRIVVVVVVVAGVGVVAVLLLSLFLGLFRNYLEPGNYLTVLTKQ